MKIVNILGGLGNQMFQYAFLVALRETFHDTTLMDTSVFHTYGLHNGFELERLFHITARSATPKELRKVTWYSRSYFVHRVLKRLPHRKTECYELPHCDYNPNILRDNSDFYYYGIWQDYRYFAPYREEILHEFTWKEPLDERNRQLLNSLDDENLVSIHVRRGDYLLHSNYAGLCGLDYYAAAIQKVKELHTSPVTFLVFSDDIPWCKEHLPALTEKSKVIYVDWNTGMDSYKDMRLMAFCRTNIIANSSFSWWAAYMNPHSDQLVIAPKRWTNADTHFDRQLPEWILV